MIAPHSNTAMHTVCANALCKKCSMQCVVLLCTMCSLQTPTLAACWCWCFCDCHMFLVVVVCFASTQTLCPWQAGHSILCLGNATENLADTTVHTHAMPSNAHIAFCVLWLSHFLGGLSLAVLVVVVDDGNAQTPCHIPCSVALNISCSSSILCCSLLCASVHTTTMSSMNTITHHSSPAHTQNAVLCTVGCCWWCIFGACLAFMCCKHCCCCCSHTVSAPHI